MAAEGSDDTSSNDLLPLSTPTITKPIEISNLIKPSKDEKLQQQRRYEEEAAIQSQRLQKELMETANLKEMKRPFDGLMSAVNVLKSESEIPQTEDKPINDESIFSISATTSKEEFLDCESDIKIDENKESELDDQRAMEDDLAVAALLQDMNDPVIKDQEEHEEYVSSAAEHIDEMSYIGMLGDEEPPLQNR